MNNYFKNLEKFYSEQLDETLNFWYNHGFDKKNGGFYVCLDRDGSIFSTDKSVWAQGRALWVFSNAYNKVKKDERYLNAALSTYDFIKKCIDKDKRMFFTVLEDGTGLQKRRYYFSETFACVGAASLYTATKNIEHLNFAREMYDFMVELYNNPSLNQPKFNPEAYSAIGLANPMIFLVSSQIMREHDPENASKYTENINKYLAEIKLHYQENQHILLENVKPDGSLVDGAKGRLVNPGHSIEASWFMMTEYEYNHDEELLKFALDVLEGSFNIGWDKKYGGLLYFVDRENRPCEQLEWDMKLWWPHDEMLIAFMMAYRITKDEKYLRLYKKVHNYSFKHFKDKQFGEWYGYLHRDGSVANNAKGNIFKGPFHLPRALTENYLQILKINKD